MKPKVSIIFPNFNGGEDVLDYLRSIQGLDYPKEKIEVILVDNDSVDGSLKLIKENFPEVKTIKLDKNYGPGFARNRGAKKALGELLFLTDEDQTLEKDCLKSLLEVLLSSEKIGVVGGKILDKKGKKLVSCGYTFNRLFGVEKGDKNCQSQKECDWVAACSMLIKKSLFEKLGGFDERFFLYAEEADFCMRVKEIGLKVVYTPNALVYHGRKKGGFKNLDEKTKYFQYYKSKFLLILKHLNFFQKTTSIFSHFLIFPLIRIIKGRKEYYPLRLKAFFTAIKSNYIFP